MHVVVNINNTLTYPGVKYNLCFYLFVTLLSF